MKEEVSCGLGIQMSASKVLADRGVAEAKHGNVLNKLESAVSQEGPNKKTIQNILNRLNEAWDVLMEKHVLYVMRVNQTLDTGIHKTWMKEKNDIHEAAVNQAERALGIVNANGDVVQEINARDVDDVKEDINLLKLKINAQIEAVEAALAEGMNIEQYNAIEGKLMAAEDWVQKDLKRLSLEVREVDNENVEAYRTEHRDYVNEKVPQVVRLLTLLASKKPQEAGAHGVQVQQGNVRQVPVDDKRRQAKLAPIAAPNYSGKAKDYAEFKLKFDEMIAPFYDESSQKEYLEKALPAKVKERMSVVRKTVAQIWDQLDEWYADPKVLIRESVADLHALGKAKMGNAEKMIKLANTLVDTEALLDGIGQGDYLRHPRELDELEEMLPYQEAAELAKRSGRLRGTDYEKFRAFLLERKTELEKLSRLGNKGTFDLTDVKKEICKSCGGKHATKDCKKKSCYSCGDEGHYSRECPKGRDICYNCGEDGHKSWDCPTPRIPRGKGQINRGGAGVGRGRGRERGQAVGHESHSNTLRTANCYRCKNSSTQGHPCAGCTKSGNALGHCLAHCPSYAMEGVTGKTDMVKRSGSCVVCLAGNHTADTCRFKDKDSSVCGLEGCKSHHHPTLHGSKDKFVTSVASIKVQMPEVTASSAATFERFINKKEILAKVAVSNTVADLERIRRQTEWDEIREILKIPMKDGDKVLLILQEIWMQFGLDSRRVRINVFFDAGSTCSLILTSVAERYGLQGHEVKVTIATVNGEKDRVTKLYVVELINQLGERKLVRALGMERISGKIPAICLDGVKHEFSTEVQEVWDAVSQRPSGEVELLVGSEVAGLHPVAHETRGDMVVLKSQFGSGWAIYGSHERLDNQHVEFSEDVGAIRQGGFKVLECGRISYEPSITLRENGELWKNATKKVGVCASMSKDFFSIEDLGVEPPRRCKDCKDCQKCSWRGMMQSEKEAEEYRMIEEGVHYSQETGRFTVTYPFIDDPYKLGNNLGQVIKIAEKLERKLEKQGYREEVNEAFDKMVEAGALRELTQMEMDRWKGPVHYVSIQHVLNLASTTTKHRLVTNTSLKDPSSGLSVNDILAKGPNCLSDAYELLIRFRGYKKGLIADISKAYHQLSVGEVESHMRRVVWKRSRGSRLQIYAIMVVSFGDRPAAVILEIAIRITIQMFGDVDKMAAYRLEFDRFVDDLTSGGDEEEVARFVGQENKETNQCSGTMPQILGGGGFKLKAMAWSGEVDGDKLKKLGSAVLGQQFSTENDTLAVILGANISKRKRGKPTGADLMPEDLKELEVSQLTRKICLSIANSIYDVLGVCAPLTIQLKLGIKKLFSEEYGLE